MSRSGLPTALKTMDRHHVIGRTAMLPAFVALLTYCGPSADAPATSPGLTQEGAHYTIGSSPIATIGGLDAPADQEFVRISNVRLLPDETIVVADAGAAQIHVFDLSGKRRKSIGRRGGGPGEFNSLTSVTATGDTLIAYDQGHGRVTWFTPTGTAIRDVTVALPAMSNPRFLGAIGNVSA